MNWIYDDVFYRRHSLLELASLLVKLLIRLRRRKKNTDFQQLSSSFFVLQYCYANWNNISNICNKKAK